MVAVPVLDRDIDAFGKVHGIGQVEAGQVAFVQDGAAKAAAAGGGPLAKALARSWTLGSAAVTGQIQVLYWKSGIRDQPISSHSRR